MKKFNNVLKESIQYIKGDILAIGLDIVLIKEINKKDTISNLYTITYRGDNDISDKKNQAKQQYFNINNLHKYFKDSSIDYTICNIDVLSWHLPFVLKDIININTDRIIFYGSNDSYDKEVFLKSLKRYNISLEIWEENNYYIINMDTSNININFLKKWFYWFLDLFRLFFEKFSNILTR